MPPPDHGRDEALRGLIAEVRACRICRDAPRGAPLPHEPRPVLQVAVPAARLMIAGQAPGTRVHASGRPFDDPSGDRLRDWLGLPAEMFWDASRVTVLPMGLCFPGRDARGGDLPPRRECAAAWHDRLLAALPPPDLLVLLGLHAARWHLARLGCPDLLAGGLDGAVAAWRRMLDETGAIVLPHPSWRTRGWTAARPWFALELLPALRARVEAAVAAPRHGRPLGGVPGCGPV